MTTTFKKIFRDVCKPLHRGRGLGWVFLLMMLTSCINDTPYDGELGAPKIVLNALLQPDSLLSATVSRTAHFLDTKEPQRLADATVTATINGREVPLSYNPHTQSYGSTYRLCQGDKVTLTATHDIGTATATQQVVTPTSISIAHTAMQPFRNPGDPVSLATLNDVDSALIISLHIDDPIDEKNYYRLTIDFQGSYLVNIPKDIYYYSIKQRDNDEESYEESSDTLISEYFYPHYLLTSSSSQLITESESAAQLLGELFYLTSENAFIFSDEHLHGKEGQPMVEFLFLMESPSTPYSDPESGWTDDDTWDNEDYIFPADTVSQANYHYHCTLETLSEDYYRYLNEVASYSAMEGIPVGEPIPINTNVQGGLGIVGSYSSVICAGDTLYRLNQ